MSCPHARIFRLALPVAVALLVGGREAAAQDPARVRLEQARSLAAQGKVESSLSALRAAVFLHRGDIEISREYQNAMARAGRKDEAVKEYRALAEAFPDEATWHYLLGRLLDGEALEKELQIALRLDPRFFWAHFGMGQYAIDHGRPREAIPHLQAARDLRPDFLEAHDALAKAHHFAGEFESAERVWAEAVRQFPRSPAPRVGLGVLYKTIGRGDPSFLPRAVDQLEAVLATWPDTWEAYEPLVQAHYAMGAPEKAERVREAARALGRRLKQDAMVVDLVDLGPRVMILTELLAGDVWIRVTTAPKGREKIEQVPAAFVARKADGSLDLYLASPAKPQEAGAFVEHYAKPPAHAALVERLRAALK
jgi:tetratricopeptide (TPR) repeat protein